MLVSEETSSEETSILVSEETKALIGKFYEAHCASGRDQLRRRIAPLVWITAPLLVMCVSYRELHSDFCKEHPASKVSYKQFRALRPWNVRKAKHEC